MARKTTITIATMGGAHEVEAQIVNLMVGEKKVRFAIHEYKGQTKLTHVASGHGVGPLNPIKLEYAVRWGTGAQMSDRAAAEELIRRVIKLRGIDHVLKVFSEAPAIKARAK